MATATTTITFQRQALGDCWEELQPLLADHWREIAHYPDIPLDVDREAYVRIEQAGALRIFTVRDYGALRGYAAFFVMPHLHYKGSLLATADVIYLSPLVRHNLLGKTFIAWCDDQLRSEGVQVVAHRSSLRRDIGSLFDALGYDYVERVWTKRLDRG
jgi:hypothetical protein